MAYTTLAEILTELGDALAAIEGISTPTVTSVFGRLGDVTAQAGDYSAEQITDTAVKVLMLATERVKLAGVEDGAQVNPADLDAVADSATRLAMAVAERAKLAGIEDGAEVNPGLVTTTINGLMAAIDKVKLDGIEAGAQVNPAAVSTTIDGLMLATDKVKLDGIAVGAQVNPTNLDGVPDSASRLAFLPGERTKLGGIADGAQVNPGLATPSTDGLLSAADKTKLDGLGGSGAVDSVFGRSGVVVAVSGDYNADQITDTVNKVLMTPAERAKLGGIEAGAQVNPGVATITTPGLMAATDKAKLDGIAAGAQVNPTNLDGVADSATRLAMTTTERAKLSGVEVGAQVNPVQVSAAEKTAGTGTTVRGFAPADVAQMATTFGGGGGVATATPAYQISANGFLQYELGNVVGGTTFYMPPYDANGPQQFGVVNTSQNTVSIYPPMVTVQGASLPYSGGANANIIFPYSVLGSYWPASYQKLTIFVEAMSTDFTTTNRTLCSTMFATDTGIVQDNSGFTLRTTGATNNIGFISGENAATGGGNAIDVRYNGIVTAGTGFTLLVSVDTTQAAAADGLKIWKNNVLQTQSVVNTWTQNFNMLHAAAPNAFGFGVGCRPTATPSYPISGTVGTGTIYRVWVMVGWAAGAADVAKFWDASTSVPLELGANGELPLAGTAFSLPTVYCNNPTATFHVDRARGVVGMPTTAPAPSVPAVAGPGAAASLPFVGITAPFTLAAGKAGFLSYGATAPGQAPTYTIAAGG